MTRSGTIVISDALRQRLDLIAHLLEHGDQIIVLRGPSGSGRSALLGRMTDKLNAPDTVQVDGRTVESGVQLTSTIAKALGLEPRHEQQSTSDFERHLAAKLGARAKPLVLVADDCETWPLELVQTLGRLHQASKGRLRAITSINLDEVFLTQLASVLGDSNPFHLVDISAFDRDGLAAYIEARASADGLPTPPLTDATLADILERSGGWPGAMELDVAELLSGQRSSASQHRMRNVISLLALVVVVVALGAVAVIRDQPKSSDPTRFEVETKPDAKALDRTTTLNSTNSQTNHKPGDLGAGNQRAPGAVGGEIALGLEPGKDSGPVETRLAPSPAAAIDPIAALPVESDSITAAVAEALSETPQIVDAKPIVSTLTENEIEAESEPAVAPDEEMQAPPSPEPGRPTAQPETAAEVRSDAHDDYSLNWLKQQAPESYAVQLFGTRSHTTATNFARRIAGLGRLTIAELEHQGAPWFVVLHGHFADRIAAEQAISRFPQSLTTAKPWPRPVATLK